MNSILKTESLLLRKIGQVDLVNIFSGLSDPKVIKHYGVSFSTVEETKEQLRWYEELENTGTGMWWAICSADNTVFYGAAGYNNLRAEHRKAELGFWLLPQHWGKGLVQEAVSAILHHGYHQMGLHRVEALVETGNTKSSKALEKLGFEKEGVMRDYEIKNGSFISVALYAKLIK